LYSKTRPFYVKLGRSTKSLSQLLGLPLSLLCSTRVISSSRITMTPRGPTRSSLRKEHAWLLNKFDPLYSSEELPLYTSHVSKRGYANGWKIRLLTLAVAVLLVVFLQNSHQHRNSPHPTPSLTRNPAHLISAKHGAVASENGRCSQIGVEVMKDGGNAVDAAISSAFCVGVVNMFS